MGRNKLPKNSKRPPQNPPPPPPHYRTDLPLYSETRVCLSCFGYAKKGIDCEYCGAPDND